MVFERFWFLRAADGLFPSGNLWPAAIGSSPAWDLWLRRGGRRIWILSLVISSTRLLTWQYAPERLIFNVSVTISPSSCAILTGIWATALSPFLLSFPAYSAGIISSLPLLRLQTLRPQASS